jgi:hypothetical protein
MAHFRQKKKNPKTAVEEELCHLHLASSFTDIAPTSTGPARFSMYDPTSKSASTT